MSGTPGSYTPQTGGQENYAPSNQLAEKYAPKNPYAPVINNWNQIDAKTDLVKEVDITRSVLFNRDLENKMEQELAKVREEFLINAKKLQEERIAEIQVDLEAKYGKEIQKAHADLDNSYRVINIQNAIFAKLFESNKDVLLKVLDEIDVTQEDLEVLASGGKPTG